MKKRVPIVMPQMGQSVAEGTIIAWKKKVGDVVQKDDLLMEIETDKTNVEVEAAATGKLVTCLKHDGDRAAAGEVIGHIEVEAADEPPPKAHGAVPGGEAEVVSSRTNFNLVNDLPEINRRPFSPYVNAVGDA